MRRRSAALAWLPLTLAACATSPSRPESPPPHEKDRADSLSRLEFPPPYEKDGIHVRLAGTVVDRYSTVYAFPGVAENRSGRDLTMIIVRFDLYDAEGAKVAEAFASSNGLKKDGVWKFQAVVLGQFTRVSFKRIESGRMQVLPASRRGR